MPTGDRLYALLGALRHTPAHPQWLSNRYHARSRRVLGMLGDAEVLDVGSGDSDHADVLGAGNWLVRLDYPVTGQHYRRQPDVHASATHLPFADERFDAVLLLEVLEHIDAADAALDEARRVLRPGGRLFVSVPFVYPIHDAPHDYRRYTVHGLRHVLEARGLAVQDEHVHGNSVVVALQMLNLAVLELARALFARHLLAGLAGALVGYPLTVLANLAAWPCTRLPLPRAASFGYFVVAQKG